MLIGLKRGMVVDPVKVSVIYNKKVSSTMYMVTIIVDKKEVELVYYEDSDKADKEVARLCKIVNDNLPKEEEIEDA